MAYMHGSTKNAALVAISMENWTEPHGPWVYSLVIFWEWAVCVRTLMVDDGQGQKTKG